MNCPYCGEVIENGETFCPKCGNRLISHTITTNYELSDTKELETFIDKNASKIMSRRFSFPSFFLGSLYYLYRKMYFLALILISLSVAFSISTYYINEDYILTIGLIYLIVYFVINIIISIKFNSIYINHANKKINKIKNKYKDESRFQIVERIKYAGSTNLLAPAIAILLISIFNTYLTYINKSVTDNISNAKYEVVEGYRKTDAVLYLNEDGSFIWYANKNELDDNFYVGKYKVYVGANALKVAKNYKLYTDGIKDKNNYYILKLTITRTSVNKVITDTNDVLIYYGLYDENNQVIDLNKVGAKDYFRLVKIRK